MQRSRKADAGFRRHQKTNDMSLIDCGNDDLRILDGEKIQDSEIATATRIGLAKGQGTI